MTRWDQPLFIVPSLPLDENSEPEPIPLNQIWEAISTGRTVRAPGVVAPQQATAGSYLTLLETATQAVVASLLDTVQTGSLPLAGGRVLLAVDLGGTGGKKRAYHLIYLPWLDLRVRLRFKDFDGCLSDSIRLGWQV